MTLTLLSCIAVASHKSKRREALSTCGTYSTVSSLVPVVNFCRAGEIRRRAHFYNADTELRTRFRVINMNFEPCSR